MKRHGGSKKDKGAAGGDDRVSEATTTRTGWQPGHLPRMPDVGGEPDWVTGLLQERLLGGLLEDPGDHERPEDGTWRLGRYAGQWVTGSPTRSHHSASADLPDYEAECEDPPEGERRL